MPRRNLNLLITPIEEPPSDSENELEKSTKKKKSKP